MLFIVLSSLLILSNCTPTIDQINRSVNSVPYNNHHPTTAQEFYSKGGNCWGYAMTKQYELEKAGYGRGEYQLVVYKGQMHIVLIVNNLVLDSLIDDLQPLEYLNTFDEVITP